MQYVNRNHFYDMTDDAACADELGAIRAEMQQLKDAASFIENLLKEKHVEVAEGRKYRVTITYGIESKRIDNKTLLAKVCEKHGIEPSHQLVSAHTKVVTSDRVSVKAHTKR